MEYDLVMYKKAHVKKIEEEYLLYHWVDDVLYNLEKIDYKSVIEKIREEYNKKNNNKK